MKVMRRYCDYDYDNNCIILFDADDAEENKDQSQSKFNWISSGDHKDKKYHAEILKKEKGKEKDKEKEKKPLRQYLEIKYKERKAIVKQQKLLKSQMLAHKQQIESMASYKTMSPISYNPQSISPLRYHPQHQSHLSYSQQPLRSLSHGVPVVTPPRHHSQHQYMNNNNNINMNMMNPNYAINVSMMQNMQNMQNIQNIQNNNHGNNAFHQNNGNYNSMRMRPRNIMY